jgi:tetratricopeptide (TPR) repeat protein
MTDQEDHDHPFSDSQGFDDPYEGFDLDPEIAVDPEAVDPLDSHVLTDLLDERQIPDDEVDADELVEVGLSYMGIQRHEQATEAFERAARFAEDPSVEQEAWTNKGLAHAELEEFDAAVDAHRAALNVDSEAYEAVAETNLAYALWERGEDEAAYRHAESAVRTDERLPQAWYNLGFIEIERARPEQAVEAFENAERLGFRAAELFEEKARALEELDRQEAAQEASARAEAVRERMEQDLVRE